MFLLPKTVTTDDAEPVAAETTGSTTESPDDEETRTRGGVDFSENVEDLSGRDERVQARADTEEVLGELLSKFKTLEGRAVERWGGLRYQRAQAAYAAGDEAYLARDYAAATASYEEAIAIVDPMLDEVNDVFERTMRDARAALDAVDVARAVQLFELAVAISPSDVAARRGFARARNLDEVIALTDEAIVQERNLELAAAKANFERATEIDPEWQPARDGLARVLVTINQMEFDQRMTEGFEALAASDYLAARAAFRMAQELKPESREPADGLLQVDQGIRLGRIATLERDALEQQQSEQWERAVTSFEAILEIDPNLTFAQDGLTASRQMVGLHERLDGYIGEPDKLSQQSTMQAATTLLVDITRMPDIGPRLSGQRDELSRLIKRAATPLTVRLVSDNATEVSIYKVGRLGAFETRQLDLRPGTYVAVGSRPGYRDVRLEFRVAPEIDMQPVVVRCEEPI